MNTCWGSAWQSVLHIPLVYKNTKSQGFAYLFSETGKWSQAYIHQELCSITSLLVCLFADLEIWYPSIAKIKEELKKAFRCELAQYDTEDTTTQPMFSTLLFSVQSVFWMCFFTTAAGGDLQSKISEVKRVVILTIAKLQTSEELKPF